MIPEMCKRSVQMKFLQTRDDLFTAGSPAEEAFLFTLGEAKYLQEPEKSAVTQTTEQQVQRQVWICEMALWMEWTHVGSVTATTDCELVVLDARDLVDALSKHRHIHDLTIAYAYQYHSRVTTVRKGRRHPTDLFADGTDFAEIVSSLSPDLRRVIGFEALDRCESVFFRRRHKLREEINMGHSTVTVNANNELQRSVVMTILLLSRESDGKCLLQLGTWMTNGEPDVQVRYPGVKRDPSSETDGEALKRLIDERLQPLVASISILNETQQSDQSERSEHYGVLTKYFRTEHRATLSGSWEDDVTDIIYEPSPFAQTKSWNNCDGQVGVLPCLIEAATRREVIAIKNEDRMRFYMWVTDEEHTRLSAPTSTKTVQRFLSCLDMVHRRTSQPDCSLFLGDALLAPTSISDLDHGSFPSDS